MTNLTVEIKEDLPVLVAFENIEKGMTQVFRNHLKNVEAPNLVNEIQYQLEHASILGTDKKYWTGTLYESIKLLSDTIQEESGKISFFVGPDPNIIVDTNKGRRDVAKYAIPVEKGTKKPFPYQYTELGYLEWKKGLGERISKELSKAVATPWAWRNIATGRWAKAPK